jgi:PAS domain-containing protein
MMPGISKGVIDKPFARYALAVVAVAAALLLRYALVQGLGLALPPFATFYPAIIIVAVLAGFGPGLLATALTALVADYFLLPPFGFAVTDISDVIALVLFATMGILTSLLAEGYRRSMMSIAAYKVEQARHESEVLYRGLFDSMDEGFCIIEMIFDPDGEPADSLFLETNAAFDRQIGLHDVVGKRMRELVPSIEEHWFQIYGKVAQTGEPVHFCSQSEALGRHFEVAAYRVGELEQRRVAIVFNDTTERMRADAHIRQLNRVYSVLSDINQTIVREKDSQAMLEAACRIAVDKGQFRMAFIGMADSAAHMLRPIASGGEVGDYLDHIRLDLLDPARSAGPSVRCFLSGEHAVCNDIEQDPHFAPWRDDALRMGYRSHASFPLKVDGQVVGIFNLYSSEPGFFDEDEIKLLDELAMDIGFALELNRREEDRRKKEEELRWRTAFFEAKVNSSIDGVLVVDSNGIKILQNQRLNELLKIPRHIAENPDNALQLEYAAT